MFDVLKRYPNLEMLKVAVKTMETPELKRMPPTPQRPSPKNFQNGRSEGDSVEGWPG